MTAAMMSAAPVARHQALLPMKPPAVPDQTIAAAALAGAVMAEVVFALAGTVNELTAAVDENRSVLDWIGETAPDIRDQLRTAYRRRRAELVAAHNAA